MVKCKICKNKIERDDAFKVVIKDKNNYYCNALEYEQHNIEKESRFKSIDLIFEIIGETTNTNLFKEITEITKVHSYTKLLNYLEANQLELHKVMNKDFGNEYGKIRYFSTIVKNQIGDFKDKEINEEVTVHADIIEEVKYKPTKKKTFADFIDEY